MCVVLTVGYVLLLRLTSAVVSPNDGEAALVELDGKVVGAANVGQAFTDSVYFWGRPSAVEYNGGSGLDPDISVRGAEVQIRRVAASRGMSEEDVRKIVEASVERPWLGLFGTYKVNVLKLNVALDEAQGR